MNIKEKLEAERAELLKKARILVEKAKDDGRETVTEEEMRTLDRYDSRRREITSKLKAIEEDEALIKRLNSFGAPDPDDTDRQRYGVLGFDPDQVKAGLVSAVRSKSSFGFDMPMNTKAAVTTGGLNLPSTGQETYSDPDPGTVVSLRDLLQLQKVESGNVRYYTITPGSGADVVEEGGEKPELTTEITPVDEGLKKIAVRFTFTDELAEDANFLVNHILREATRAVLRRENELILDTLASTAGALTSTGNKADAIDVIAGAIGAAQATNGITPTVLVANPIDVAEIRTQKATGSGDYRVDPLTPAPTAIHGVPLQAVPTLTPGSMYLISPGVGVFYTRSGLRVETGYVAGDWEHNRVTTRVEERVLPAIIQPTLLTKITLNEE